MSGTQKMRMEIHKYPFTTAETHGKTCNEGAVESIGPHTLSHTAKLITHLIAICQPDKSIQGK